MDFLDYFENMGFGVGIIIIIFLIVIVIMFSGRIIPALLMGFGSLLFLLIIIVAVGAVIYFVGKFAKDFIKK
jgi:hypothetical protein